MKNPSNSRAYSGAGLINPENPLNSPGVSNSQGYNTFDLSNQQPITPRFSELTPFSVIPVESADRINLQTSHKLNTYTLSAPLLSEVRMNKDYFFVPKSAMLPNTWEYLFVNPNKGDDVPDDAYPIFDIKKFVAALMALWTNLTSDDSDSPNDTPLFGWLLGLMYKTLGYGSLLDNLGYREHIFKHYNQSRYGDFQEETYFGKCFDNFVNYLITGKSNSMTLTLYEIDLTKATMEKGNLVGSIVTTGAPAIAVRRFLLSYFNSSKPLWLTFQVGQSAGAPATISVPYSTFVSYFVPSFVYYLKFSSPSYNFIKPYNLYRLIAYHMSCAQFFSNDVIDNVYSAKIWLQNMESLQRYSANISSTATSQVPTYFGRNGIQIRYDVFSKKNLDRQITYLSSYDASNLSSLVGYGMMFWHNLFEYHRALRYGDYFCGGRTQPLAVGDIDIAINNQMVSPIDITHGLSMQRFLNAVNRVGQLVADYARNIFGVAPKNLPPQPRFVNHESQVIGGQTVTNTAESQGTLNQNLVSNGSKFAYDIFIDEPGILLGICSFTCLPCYDQTTPRDIYHYDRLDDFQPFLQNIGDQQIFSQELKGISDYNGSTWDGTTDIAPFAYQLQDAEYKYGISEAHGAFVHVLQEWLFMQEVDYGSIDSDFLRLWPYQFDKFYKSLTGFSTETYFHFIVSFVNKVTANRRMMYRPGIL